MQLDDELCYCFHVSCRKVMNFLRVHQPRRPSQLSECGGAGTGCGWCVPYLKKCFQNYEAGKPVADEQQGAAEYAAARSAYIKAGRVRQTPPSDDAP